MAKTETEVKHEEEPMMVWDTCEIIKTQVEHLLEQNKDEREADPEVEELDEDEAWNSASNDSFIFDDEWEYLMEYLTEVMQEINPGGCWYAEVCNFGWMSQDGHKTFKADNGRDFLSEILPETDCTFKVYKRTDEDGKQYLAIRNWHHDAPTGNERYTIKSAIGCESCGEVIRKGEERKTDTGHACESCYFYDEDN